MPWATTTEDRAKLWHARPVAVTFNPRPEGFFKGTRDHQLFTEEQKTRAFGELGISHQIVQIFDEAFSQVTHDDFYATYYSPQNITLLLVGDFDPVQVRALVEKYFGSIPRAAEPPPEAITVAPITAERRLDLTDGKADLAKVYFGWVTPSSFQPGDAELTLAATSKVTGKVLDSADHRRLIEDAISELDFSLLERGRA